MLRLKPFIGVSDYYLPDPDHQDHIHRGKTKEELIKAIESYRSQNQLEPLEHLPHVIENFLCTLPQNIGNCEANSTLSRGWLQYLKGGITLFKYIFMGEMVPQEEADRRSEVCANCPKNVFPDRNKFIRWSDSIAEHATGGKRSSRHADLGNCEICSCTLKAKVWQKPPIKVTPKEKLQMEAVNCWQTQAKHIVEDTTQDG